MQLHVGRWLTECDPDITRLCYLSLPTGINCSCTECRNFTAAGDGAFPASFLAFADLMGIDPKKPAELMHWQREPSGLLLTGGRAHFVGQVESAALAVSRLPRVIPVEDP